MLTPSLRLSPSRADGGPTDLQIQTPLLALASKSQSLFIRASVCVCKEMCVWARQQSEQKFKSATGKLRGIVTPGNTTEKPEDATRALATLKKNLPSHSDSVIVSWQFPYPVFPASTD